MKIRMEEAENFTSYLIDPKKPICPRCEAIGEHKGKTKVAMLPGKNKYKCFNCGFFFDSIDVWKKQNGLALDNSTTGEALAKLATQYYPNSKIDVCSQAKPLQMTTEIEQKKSKYDFGKIEQFLIEAEKANTDNPKNYLLSRGISYGIQELFNIGYCANWRHPLAPNSLPSERCIIPSGNGGYTAVAIDRKKVKKEFWKQKTEKAFLFNYNSILSYSGVMFIVEGEIDALSICEVGGNAAALGSTSAANSFISRLTNDKNKLSESLEFVICLDNDETGTKAQKELVYKLQTLGIKAQAYTIPSDKGKDPNEFLLKDKEAFTEWVKNAPCEATFIEQEKETYINEPSETIKSIKNAGNIFGEALNTGIDELNEALGGGIRNGLYILGAVSSAGKTSFVIQVAYNLAKLGNDILYFTLEMGTAELVLKSISRLSFTANDGEGAADVLQVSNGYATPQISEAWMQYETNAKHLRFIEGIGNIGIEQILNAVVKHKQITGKSPIIIIDYLQLLASPDPHDTDKMKIDKNVMELKRISRDFSTPVIAISSFNRQAYDKGANMANFKESGGTEYSADVLITLTMTGDDLEAKSKTPREIDLTILKNRVFKAGEVVKLFYYPKYSFFTVNKIESFAKYQ